METLVTIGGVAVPTIFASELELGDEVFLSPDIASKVTSIETDPALGSFRVRFSCGSVRTLGFGSRLVFAKRR